MDYILKNGRIASLDEIKDIYIKGGKIERIGENIKANGLDVEIIDLENRLVLDGFVDAHMHLDKALINERIANRSGTLDEAIRIMGEYKPKMSMEDIKDRANRVLEKAYGNGTRYIRTHVDVDHIIKLNSLQALMEIREEWKDKVEMQIVAFPQEGVVDKEEAFHYLREAVEMGADIVGGIPAREENPVEHISMIFDLALKHDLDIDMHIDETDDPKSLTLRDLANMAVKNGYIGRVSAGHCCSLAANEKEDILPILELVKEASLNIISLPSTNLYLQGRGDTRNIRRGITPIKYMIEQDVDVFIASDNVRDAFNPFGNANLLEIALITAHGAHMGGEENLKNLFDMVSHLPMEAFGFNKNLKVGNRANFIMLDAVSKPGAIISQSGLYGYFEDGKLRRKE
ncbi:MAG TPA: amidohydrolase family protein [Tepidimicrobium sp.]|nr:amidohydrolase family protein [Tepidimicrobium sp.]